MERIWREVLGINSARAADNFIELGGNSILAIQMASRISERLAVELEPADVLLAHSLAELTARVRHDRRRDDPVEPSNDSSMSRGRS